jgi:SAM-dependent methyltransferase
MDRMTQTQACARVATSPAFFPLSSSGRPADEMRAHDPYGEAYFEGRSSNYWWTVGNYENLKDFPHWREVLKLLLTHKNKGKLLDIGCAYGLLVNAASKHFESYGIDVSQFAIEKSKRFCKGTISRASATNLPFKDESFDMITVLDTLEHVRDLDRCLQDIVRTLKVCGILLLQLPNPSIWRFSRFVGLGDETHVNDFRLLEWKGILAEKGLRVVNCFGLISYAFKKIPFFIKSGRAARLFPELWMVAAK